MTVARLLAITPLTDITTWLRGRGLEIVLLVLGAVLLARFVTWCGRRITRRMDEASSDLDVVVRSEEAKHRGAVPGADLDRALSLLFVAVLVLYIEVRPPRPPDPGRPGPRRPRGRPPRPAVPRPRGVRHPTSTTGGATGTSAPPQTTVGP